MTDTKEMDYKKTFNVLAKSLSKSIDDNILHNYDNITYNIRFYMLNSYAQEQLAKIRSKTSKYHINNRDKVIIAESGVTSNISIESLLVKSVYSSTVNTGNPISYELQLKINEVNGMHLINYINFTSKLLGYETYLLTPYHIDIWFSGYENATHKPVNVIPINGTDGIMSYEVIMNEVKTNVKSSGTSYNFICSCAATSVVDKSITNVSNQGLKKASNFKSFVEILQKDINDKFFQRFQTQNGKNEIETKMNGKFINFRVFDRRLLSNISDNEIELWQNGNVYFSTKELSSCESNLVNANEDQQETNSKEESIEKLLNEYIRNSKDLCTCRLGFKYHNVNRIVVGKDTFQQLVVDVYVYKDAYIDDYTTHYTNDNVDDYNQYKMCVNKIEEIINTNALKKSYNWLFSGTNIDVLEFNSSIDKLWTSSIPLYAVQTTNNSIPNLNFYKPVETSSNEDTTRDELEKAVEESNKNLSMFRTLARDGRLYVEDLYYGCNDTYKKELMELINVPTLNDFYSTKSNTGLAKNIDDQNKITVSKLGYQNIVETNLSEIKIKILGDPYWMGTISDKNLISNNDSSMNYIIFKLMSPMSQGKDNTYSKENAYEISTIYQVSTINSMFSNGKFTQDIQAVSTPEFLNIGRMEI